MMDALPFLSAKNTILQRFYALSGDEDSLKHLVREKIVGVAVGDADAEFAVSVYAGDKLDFSTVRNDLETLPFLAPCRVVIVENADAFVTDYRPQLEQYAAKPSPIGVLVLEAKSFPETTKLAKALPDSAKIACKPPQAYRLPAWCVDWAKSRYGKKLATDSAELLVELVGVGMGMLDQELDKLASAVGARPAITVEDVQRLVGRSKVADVFRIMDAVGEGNACEALSILEDLFAEGEDPMAILGPLTAQLRKLAAVGRLTASGMALGPALTAAKVPAWDKIRASFEKQLRHLGRRRLNRLTEWLAEINLGVKGGNALPERVQVERLIVMLARPREEVKQ